jgi:hypothetical protein
MFPTKNFCADEGGQSTRFWFRYTLQSSDPHSEAEGIISRLRQTQESYLVLDIACQAEVGQNGTPHIQGCVRFSDRKRAKSAKELLRTGDIMMTECLFVGPLLLADYFPMRKYCLKDEGRLSPLVQLDIAAKEEKEQSAFMCILQWFRDGGEDHARKKLRDSRFKLKIFDEARCRWLADMRQERREEQLASIFAQKLRPWQQKIADLLKEEPHPRHIIFVIDKQGNTGKTFLCSYLEAVCPSEVVVIQNGKTADLAFIVSQKPGCQSVLFMLPRSAEGHTNYGAIESFKDGIFVSSKYHSVSLNEGAKHVVCFSNTDPDLTQLSKDRYRIFVLDPNGQDYVEHTATSFSMMYPDGYNRQQLDMYGKPMKRTLDDWDDAGPSLKEPRMDPGIENAVGFHKVFLRSAKCPDDCYDTCCNWRRNCDHKGRSTGCFPFSLFQCKCSL